MRRGTKTQGDATSARPGSMVKARVLAAVSRAPKMPQTARGLGMKRDRKKTKANSADPIPAKNRLTLYASS
jgi:hypothetical protein